MAVTYAVAATALNRMKVAIGNNAITPASGNCVDGGGSFGVLVIGTSSLAGSGTGVLASFTLQNPSFSYATRTGTLLGVPLAATASGSGTAAKAELRDSNGVVIINGLTVTASGGGGDIIINTVTITSGEACSCTSGTLVG